MEISLQVRFMSTEQVQSPEDEFGLGESEQLWTLTAGFGSDPAPVSVADSDLIKFCQT